MGTRLFGADQHSERREAFYEAVTKALRHYCEKFAMLALE
jgi:hypothetical protein